MTEPSRKNGNAGPVWLRTGFGLALAALASASPLQAQELADYDYENLSFRGFGVDIGAIFPNRLDATTSFGVWFDLGFLGPGFRLSPSISYWSSSFKTEEVQELEDRLQQLIVQNDPESTATVALGMLDWSDLVLGLDGAWVWPFGTRFETALGFGFAAHIMNGEGAAITGTFVEDLLDRVTIGANAHWGLSVGLAPRIRADGQLRFEILDDLHYPQIRAGLRVLTGGGAGS